MAARLLCDVLPGLAEELKLLFEQAARPDLARQLPSLRVRSRCSCGDEFCATLYTGGGKPADSIYLEPSEGMITVELDGDERIVGIEILYRDDYREAIDNLFQKKSESP